MMYIALLRGINVGGKNKVVMKQLINACEAISLKQVQTYINTGNIIFVAAKHDQEDLVSELEALMKEQFAIEIKVLLLTAEKFTNIHDAIPSSWQNNKENKSDVLFLWEIVDTNDVLNEIKSVESIDHTLYVPGALLWSVARENIGKSGMQKLIGTKLYKQVTVRNVNTVRKLMKILKGYETEQ